MPSLTTIYRAGVMIAVAAIVYTGWQHYGLSGEKVKSAAARAVDMAQAAWKNLRPSDKDANPAPDPPGAAPAFAQATQQPASNVAIVPPALSKQSLTPSPPVGAPTIGSASSTQPPITPVGGAPSSVSSSEDRVHALLSRLEQLGGADVKLTPWGSSGRLFRCCCEAPLANSTAVTQHFESVAAERELAAEQVLAKVEAWRAAQRSGSVLR
jgi:hypothetical protein